MKKIILLLFILVWCNTGYSQDTLLYFLKQQRVALENLHADVRLLYDKLNKIDPLGKTYDQSNELNDYENHTTVPGLTDGSDSTIDISELELYLKHYADSLSNMMDSIQFLDKKVKELQLNLRLIEDSEFLILDRFELYYGIHSFDELVANSSLTQIERDISVIEGIPKFDFSEMTRQKLSDVQKYFWAEQVLSRKYDEAELSEADNYLNSIDQKSKHIPDLQKELSRYHIRCDGLRSTLQNIKSIDQEFIANDEYTQKEKFKYIVVEVTDFLYNYDIGITKGNYISEIVIEVLLRKREDANADIDDLLERL